MQITFRHKGNLSRAKKYLFGLKKSITKDTLARYGEAGVSALKSATPVDSGLTASSWRYEIETTSTGYSIVFHNDNIVDGWFNVAIMLDVGHGTRNGGWVEGQNYIEPALRPIFNELARSAWAEVTSL